MNVDIKQLPKSRVELSISLPWEEWKHAFDHAFQELSSEVKVAGFRPGKAPRALIEQKLGKGAILAEAVNHTLRESYERALREKEIDAIGRPEAEVKKTEEGGDFEYIIRTAVMPEVVFGNWEKAVKKVNQEFSATEKKGFDPSGEEISAELLKIAESRATFEKRDREARSGDAVNVDFRVLRDGVPIENGSSKDHHLVLGKGVFIPGFEEAILGMKVGEEKTVELSFPEKYHAAHLAGQKANFEIKLNMVEEPVLPLLDDAFAHSLGKFETLDALRESIRSGMAEERKTKQKEARRGKILEAIVGVVKAELPDVLVEEELGKMLAEFEAELQSSGFTLDQFFSNAKKTREELEKEWRPGAEKRVLSALSLERIAKDRLLEASAEDIEAEMNRTLQYYRSVKDAEKNIDLARLHQYAKGRLTNEKVLEFLEKLV